MERLRQLIHEIHRRSLWQFAWILPALAFSGTAASLSAQSDDDALLGWARETGIRLATVEPGNGFADLQDLKPLVGSARIVALGEAVHRSHEFLALRNRLFEFLVEELDFTAIAVETGFSEAWAVEEYVQGGPTSGPVAQNVFSWATPQVWVENQQLIDWMREYNARPPTVRKIHFYGFDLSGVTRNSRIAADAALAYLDRVDPTLANRSRSELEMLLPRFNLTGHPLLEPSERDALTARLADLVSILQGEKPAFVNLTGESDYDVAYRHALMAQRSDAYFRARIATPDDWTESSKVRDESMASNVRWALEREGDDGRVFMFAANGHVKTGPFEWPDPYRGNHSPGHLSAGEYLRPIFGDELVVIGTVFGGGQADAVYERSESTSVDGVLARIGAPLLALALDPDVMPKVVWEALARPRSVRAAYAYGVLDLTSAFDVLLYVDTLTLFRRVDPPR